MQRTQRFYSQQSQRQQITKKNNADIHKKQTNTKPNFKNFQQKRTEVFAIQQPQCSANIEKMSHENGVLLSFSIFELPIVIKRML